MKRWLSLGVMVSLALLLTGCEPQVCLSPLYQNGDTLFDKQLLGEWQVWSGQESRAGDTPGTIVFSAANEAYTYEVRIPNFDPQGKSTLFTEARLVKLGDAVFIDFGTPNSDKLSVIPYPMIEAHAVGRIVLNGDKAQIDLLGDDWVKDSIKDGKMPLAFQEAPNRVITASTADLRQFAMHHAEDRQAWSEAYTMERKSSQN
jgi:hypothetical protein